MGRQGECETERLQPKQSIKTEPGIAETIHTCQWLDPADCGKAGFHRWTVAGEEPLVSMLDGKVPVVIVDHKDKAGNIYGTVTHNRARGTHLLGPMKAIVKELMAEGKSVEEIGKQLGMRPEEIFRLSEFSKEDFLKMMIKPDQGFSKAEFITKI